MRRRYNHRLLMFTIVGLSACAILVWQWSITKAQFQSTDLSMKKSIDRVATSTTPGRIKTPEKIIKGLYLTAYSAGNSKKVDQIIDLIAKTELNAVVIDIKDYSGKVLYDTSLTQVNKMKIKDVRIKNLPDLIKKFHDNDIYVIARQTVFQDPELAQKRPDWALKNKEGGLWRDKNGLAWVDMTNRFVWEYNMDIAHEAIKLGFDEINFDYVRFPSDGNIKNIVYKDDKKKYEVMRNFFHFVNQELATDPAWISIDLFGLVMEHTDDMGIGQRLVDAVNEVDYISPMMYPSHYYPGHLNFTNPADHPTEVIDNGMKKGSPVFENKRAKLRPWLQAFDLGAKYDAKKIRAQIDMVEKYPNAGWLLWNAGNKYTDAGLKAE